MKTQILAISMSALLMITSLNGCSSSAPRITPGTLQVSGKVSTHSARITNIVQLSEKEAPSDKMFLGDITGMLIAATLTDDKSDLVQDIATELGGDLGKAAVMDQYGKTIYRLTLVLDNGLVKQIHVRGGAYVVGRHAKITVHKKSGAITSLVALKS